jgi:hypothetical protein
MTYRGTIHNGVVVFDGSQRPPEGTQVEIRPVAPVATPSNGSGTALLDQIAQQQGVTRPAKFDDLLGGWPAGEEGDGFEDAVTRWRSEEPRRAEF